MDNSGYVIKGFGDLALRDVFIEASSAANVESIKHKRHIAYFFKYLSDLGAKTMLIELDYTDRDYLEDYAGFYARCFSDYKKRCKRVHFFDKEVAREEFREIILYQNRNANDEKIKELDNSYLGFIVLKPLPEKIIGRTCLKTYSEEEDKGRRSYPITWVYDVNLFGLTLHVESLAFQEQDEVASVCATSALWSVFHGTGKLFQHSIPSPYNITKVANERYPVKNRSFPSSGLSIEQMAQTIKWIG